MQALISGSYALIACSWSVSRLSEAKIIFVWSYIITRIYKSLIIETKVQDKPPEILLERMIMFELT